MIRGKLERQDGVTNLVADKVVPLEFVLPAVGDRLQSQSSRDFR